MTAEQLRNSILQEAISGRLVPQDPNDEPASILLERIVAEQNRLLPSKKKKSVALITEPEDITPVSGWAYFYIRDIFDTTSGGTPIKGHPEYYGGDIPWVRSGELNSLYLYDSELCITEAGLKNSSAKYFPVNTVVIAMYGATIGKTSIFKRSMTTNQAICGIFPIDGILPEYIYYFLQNKKRDYCSIAFGSGQPNISQEKIKNTIFPLPPLAEQKRIVAKLEELLPIVEQYGKAQKELDELNATLPARLRQSILQEAISGKLVPQDENDEFVSLFLERLQKTKEVLIKQKILKKDALSFGVVKEEDISFEIPANWEWRYLGDLVYLVSGTSYKKDDVRNSGIRILRGGNIVNDKLVLADDDVFLSEEYRSEEKNIKPNDIVIVASTGSKKVIGKPALVQEPIADTQIGAFLRIVRPIDTAYVPYLWTLFRSEYYRGHIRDLVKGTNINNIKEEYLTYMPIPFPPLAEQQRIVAKIEELFEQIDKISK